MHLRVRHASECAPAIAQRGAGVPPGDMLGAQLDARLNLGSPNTCPTP